MSKRKKLIEEFFSTYEKHFNETLAGKETQINQVMTEAFTECFVESNPGGVICNKNDQTFSEKTKQGFAFYRSIGTTGMNIISKEITLLDDGHALVNVYWRYHYEKDDQTGSIDFHVVYLVRTNQNEVRIFTYIKGDEMKVLKENGLIQANQEMMEMH